MPTKIFLTGVTGYIGGDAFYALHKAHPDFEYSLLVRNEERAKPVREKYPDVKFVFATDDKTEPVVKAAAEADIVFHTADSSDGVPYAQAIAKGLAGRPADRPGYWIHTSGTGILLWNDIKLNRFGEPPIASESYDDIKDIDRLLNLPDDAPHRNVDKIVLGAANPPAARTVVVAPPTIYGPGRGPVNQRSIQVYDLARLGLRWGAIPIAGAGLAEWTEVHVQDLSRFYVSLVEAALDPARNTDPELFGPHAYFFAENGTFSWGDVSRWIAAEAHRQGFLPEPALRVATLEEVEAEEGVVNGSWGLSSKSSASRARKLLGWKPVERSLKDEIPDIVALEAKRLGLSPCK